VFGGGGPDQTKEDVERRVAELGWWYHHFELPSGVWTGDGKPPAYDPNERWEFIEPYLPPDLEGKTVLDVGGNSGYFTLKMKQLGAGRCVMVEPADMFVEQAHFVFEQFEVDVEVVHEDVHAYCLTTSDRFDYVLFLGLFYHLKYGVLVLDRLAEMTKERIFFNSHIEGPPAEETGAATAVERDDLRSAGFPRLSFLEVRTVAMVRTGGFRTTRRSSRWPGVPASRSSRGRTPRCSSPSRRITSARRASATSSSLWEAGRMDLSRACSLGPRPGPGSARELLNLYLRIDS
jgi:tRNA (mo5U34)-methyltransferase